MKGPDAFAAYYRAQHLVADHDWDPFFSCLETAPPATFTVVAGFPGGLGRHLLNRIVAGQYAGLDPIAWYPGTVAWQVRGPRSQWSPELRAMLKLQTDIGTIMRQELVSMVPVLVLLDQRRPASVLDICAAPGSKTSQLLQLMEGSGVVVANDCSAQRADMLMSRMRSVASPSLVVTRCDAAEFPLHDQFDCVLCDIPCSGDGTIRKAPKLLKHWKSTTAMALHAQQIQIARRSFLLTKPGGHMVYSTCSLNPVENEAVVLALLDEFANEITVVDTSAMLPGLHRSPGLATWSVMAAKSDDHRFRTFADREEVKSTAYGGQCVASVFASGPNRRLLSRCMRLLPHHNDSGGFFVALIERHALDRPRAAPAPACSPRFRGHSLFPFAPIQSTPGGADLADCLRRSVGLCDSFPFADLHVRQHDDEDGGGRRARLYLLTAAASRHAAFHTQTQGLIHAGVRVFERCVRPDGVPVEYRMCWEAHDHLLPNISPYLVRAVSLPRLRQLLRSCSVPFESVPGLRQELVGDEGAGRGNLIITCTAPGSHLRLAFAARIGARTVQLMNPGRSFEAFAILL